MQDDHQPADPEAGGPDEIRVAGFGLDEIETGYMKGPKPWTFMYQGSAKNDRAELNVNGGGKPGHMPAPEWGSSARRFLTVWHG